jgi:hypothetical protein
MNHARSDMEQETTMNAAIVCRKQQLGAVITMVIVKVQCASSCESWSHGLGA